jgi:signal transduction histidine kinase
MNILPTILIVDDNETDLEVTKAILNDLDSNINCVSSGEHAIMFTKVVEPAVILIDVSMPVMDGLEAGKRIRNIDQRGYVPIIFITAYGSPEILLESYKTGAVDFLEKPVDPKLLRAKVKVFLELFNQKIQIDNQKNLLKLELIERKKIESELRSKSQDLYREKFRIETIIESAPYGIIVLNSEGFVTLANKHIKELFLNLSGIFILENFDFKQIDQNENLFTKSFLDLYKSNNLTSSIIEPSIGLYLEISKSNLKLPSDESPFATFIEVRNISSRMEFDKIRNQFIYTVCHELRISLTVISLSVDNLIKYWENLEIRIRIELLNRMKSNSLLMTELMEDLLLISKMESRKLIIQKQPIKFSIIINEISDQLEQKIHEKNCVIVRHFDENSEIFADKRRIGQVLRNLIDNAIKYSGFNGQIKIRLISNILKEINEKNVECSLIEIIDQGLGIKKEDIPKIFERFYRTKDVSHLPGTGLGLSICKEIIKQHLGEILIESEFGIGTKVSIYLPLLNNPY